MKITAIILEDEQIAAKRLIRMLAELNPDIDIIAVYETIEETADHLLNHGQPDILFVDIHVADGNSFELFRVLEVKSNVIFITAYDQYAIEAFRKNAKDYLLKPLKKDQLQDAINKATPLLKNEFFNTSTEYKKRFLIKFGNKLSSVNTEDIAYVFSKNKVSYFFTYDLQRYASDFKLQELEELLDPKLFFRVNRQFIIHHKSIKSILKHNASRIKLSLQPHIDEEIIISTEKSRKFKSWLG